MRAVAFVRNVMIRSAGIGRKELLRAFLEAGATAPRSYLATGNVSFTLDGPIGPEFSDAVARRLSREIGRREPVFVRTVQRLQELADLDVFGAVETNDVHERCVTFLPPGTTWRGALPQSSPRGDVRVVAAHDEDLFSVTRLVGGRPGTAGPLVEKQVGAPVTTRNWRTIERILRSPGD